MRIVAPFIGVVLIAAFVVNVAVVLVAAAAVYGMYWLVRNHGRKHRARRAAAEHGRAELLARAELQHRWFMDADPRGTYGRYTPAI